jgi:MinD superfamily P-loop ATPase
MKRALDLIARFRIPAGVILNKADLDSALADRVVTEAARRDVPILGRVPFDRQIPEAMGRAECALAVPGTRAAVVAAWQSIVAFAAERRATSAPREYPVTFVRTSGTSVPR